MVITPWRSVLVCDLDEGVADVALRVLAPMGLVFDENSPWLRVSACTGQPGLRRTRSPTSAPTRPRPSSRAARKRIGTSSAASGRAAARRGEVLVATARRLPAANHP